MLFITNINSLSSLSDKDSEKLAVKPEDTIAFIEDTRENSSVPVDKVLWMLNNIHSSDVRLIPKNSLAALVTLGTLLSKSSEATIIGNPFGLSEKEQKAYITEVFKDYKVSVFGEKKRAKKPVDPKQEEMVKKEVSKAAEPVKVPKEVIKPPAITKKKTKGGILDKLGVDMMCRTPENEERLSAIIKKAKDFDHFRSMVCKELQGCAGNVMLKTTGMKMEELKALAQ